MTRLVLCAAGSTATDNSGPHNNNNNMKIIDSHLHVWADSNESQQYPYDPNQIPPPALQNTASIHQLLQQMNHAGVHGALIVQPINYKYDHRYVLHAIQTHPDKFKGMLLFDPSLEDEDLAVQRLDELVLDGFVGVRFNPYLFDGTMNSHRGAMAVFRRCAELQMPVGIMCFKGIDLHYEDIVNMIQQSPNTPVILDHFGFAAVQHDNHEIDNDNDDKKINRSQQQFHQVLSLAKYDNVAVKISALFRLGDDYPYERVRKERFEPLLEAYGAKRLMFGTDFPYVLQQKELGGYKGAVDVVYSWLSSSSDSRSVSSSNREEDQRAIMGGTAERLFGAWFQKN